MDKIIFVSELIFETSRSGGAGGQHVNKTETKVSAIWKIRSSLAVSDEEKVIIFQKLGHELINNEYLKATDQSTRSQLTNKNFAISKLILRVENALKVEKKRIPVKPTIEDIKKRLHIKRKKSELKQHRSYNWEKDI